MFMAVAFTIGDTRVCAVESGSMEPYLMTGSMALINTKATFDDIEVGDIVVYRREADDKNIIHRVVDITDDGLIMKGDANRVTDPTIVTEDILVGRYLGHVEWAGYIAMFFQSDAGRIVIFSLIALLMIPSFDPRRRRE